MQLSALALVLNLEDRQMAYQSTCTNLLQSRNDWTIVLQDNDAVTFVYIEFCKAFDTVSHPKLLPKLISYGISGNVYLHGSKNILIADHTVHTKSR